VRFIVYRQEFVAGERTTPMRDGWFASEDEGRARRKQKELFELERTRYQRRYGTVETATEGGTLIVRALEQGRFVEVGLIDELYQRHAS